MRKDGRLSRQEERTVYRAIGIINEWVRHHQEDERQPYAWGTIVMCVHQLEDVAWNMCDAA